MTKPHNLNLYETRKAIHKLRMGARDPITDAPICKTKIPCSIDNNPASTTQTKPMRLTTDELIEPKEEKPNVRYIKAF
ncbi:MAG: hypothetical protein AAF429_09145 [Pseudomonadota bacterium]